MKTTWAGAAGSFVASEAKGQETKIVDSKGKGEKVLYRTLGKHRVEAPVINMGS